MRNKIALALIVVLSMVVLAGCGGNSPTDVVNSYFKEIKSGENNEVSNYIVGTVDEQTATDQDTDPKLEEAISIYVSKLDAKVLSEKVDGDKATVEVELNGLNFGQMMITVLQENIADIFSGKEQSSEDIGADFLAAVKSAKPESRKGKINLTKVDNKWKIEQDNDLITLVFGSVE